MDAHLAEFCGRDPETFRPRDNDADCMALANALRNDGWIVHITFGHGAYTPYDAVVVENHPERMDYRQSWTGDDWKQGVCDLAEPICKEWKLAHTEDDDGTT